MFGLFKDEGDDGNGELKYHAPKASALKKKQTAEIGRQNSTDSSATAKSEGSTGSQKTGADTVQQQAGAPANTGILFSSSIYLYRVNSAGAYDVVDGGEARVRGNGNRSCAGSDIGV